MGPMIHLTRDAGALALEVPGDVLCVRHRAYPAPRIDAEHITVDDLREDVRGWLDGRDALVFVGLTRAMTPSNRTDDVWEILFNGTDGLLKHSVDHTLFVHEPWRAWLHFGLVGAPYAEYTYSYLAESHWKAHRDGVRDDDPFDLASIVRWGRGVVRSTHPRHFDEIAVEVIALDDETHAAYAEAKREAFDTATTLAGLVRHLGRFAADACPERKIPTRTALFRRRSHHVVATDLPIDRFLVDRLRSLVDLTDGVAWAFHEQRADLGAQGVLL